MLKINNNTVVRHITALVAVAVFILISIPVSAAVYNGSSVLSNNIHEHVYTTNSKVSNSYMFANPDGTVSRIENYGDVILHEKYSAKFKLAYQGVLPIELPRFGGAYSGANYNYLVFGQDNPEKNKTKEVIRIVKYDKNWSRIGAISITNCDTTVPFSGSNTDFAEYGNCLYIRCGHTAFNGNQGSLTIGVRTDNNSVMCVSPQSSAAGAEYIDATGGIVTTAEKSLMNPNCAVISKYNNGVGANTFAKGVTYVTALGSSGALTQYIPQYSIGGFAASPQYNIMVGNSQPMDGTSTNNNIVVVAVPRNNFTTKATTISYMTGYAQGSPFTAETPFLVKVNDNMFAILWEERNGYSDTCKVYYMFINGQGQRITDKASIDGCLSDCQPIIYGGNIVWYTTNGASMKIYAIPVSGSKASSPTYNTNATSAYSLVYDYNFYMNKYPDCRVLYSNNEAGAFQNFKTSGMAAGRQGSANFDPLIYKANYPDLAAAFGNNWPLYYQHYMNCGYAEGRNATTIIKK